MKKLSSLIANGKKKKKKKKAQKYLIAKSIRWQC